MHAAGFVASDLLATVLGQSWADKRPKLDPCGITRTPPPESHLGVAGLWPVFALIFVRPGTPDSFAGLVSSYLDSEQEAKIYVGVVLCCLPIFGQSGAQERAQRPRLEKRYINQTKLAREIDSMAPRKVKFKIWP